MSTPDTPLGGFEQRLLGELREIVAGRPAPALTVRTHRRVRSRATRVWATGIAVVAAAALALLVLGTSGGGPTRANAFTGWSASPTAPADGQLAEAEAACEQRNHELASLEPQVSDIRGPDSLLVYATATTTTTCVTGDVQLGTVALSEEKTAVAVAAGAVAPVSIGLEFAADGQAFREMTGEVGADVTGLAVVLESGSSVEASVRGGWFAAWWPVSEGFESGKALALSLSQSIPRSFQVSGASGTAAQPLTLAEIEGALQAPSVNGSYGASGATGATAATGATGASGNTAPTVPGIDPALLASFAIARAPQPSPVTVPEEIAGPYTGPAQAPNPYGVNPEFAQYAPAADTWILPGSSGVCMVVIGVVGPPPIGSGSCAPTSLALSGDFFGRWQKWPTHEFWMVGLAPDGNTMVTVNEADGSTSEVPVTDNLYVVAGGDPSSVTLRDASGALTTVPIPAPGS